MTETTITDVAKGRSGYGSAPLTVSVYNFDPSLGCDDATFQPCSPRALSSLKVVGDRFKDFFPLSKNFTINRPPYFGFFTEDQFIGGHVSIHPFVPVRFTDLMSLSTVAPILLVFQLGRAAIRCAYHLGHDWIYRSHTSLTQVLEAVRRQHLRYEVQEGYRRIQGSHRPRTKVGKQDRPAAREGDSR